MNKPSPAEIAFAQKRFQIQAALAPYFLQRVESSGFQACEVDGDLATADGTRLREDTIKGQSLITRARLTTADGVFHEVGLMIQHTEEWWPAVTVFTNHGGPTPTTVIKNDVDAAIPDLKKRIDEVFRSIPPKQ